MLIHCKGGHIIRTIAMTSAESLTALQQAALSAQVAFYSATFIGLVATAFFGIVRYRIFRSGRPFITISLEASSRPSSSEHIHIGVTAKLYNGSRVLATADELEWECRALAAYDSSVISGKIQEYFSVDANNTRAEPGNSEFPWNVQQRITKRDLDIEIEPNEYCHHNISFIVPRYCRAVQVRLFVPTNRNKQRGWTAVIYHDANNAIGEQT